jgi:hypothetical protein
MTRRSDLFEQLGEGRDYVVVTGSFKPLATIAASASVLTSNQRGRGFQVSRSGAGVYALHFDNDYMELVSAIAGVQTASADDMEVEVGAFVAPTSSAKATLALRLYDDADNARTAADMSDDSNNRIHFRCTFRLGSLTP